MFNSAFHDLLKPQWLRTLTELKMTGGMAVSDLAKRFDASYMTVKQHCEDLTKRGYLKRSRVPRTEIGRPEIFYSLSERAEAMFPQLSPQVTLDLLAQVQRLFGETAPEKLLFQYFQEQGVAWAGKMAEDDEFLDRAQYMERLREKTGVLMKTIENDDDGGIIIREFHNPMQSIFAKYPRAIAMEQRAMEAALGRSLRRHEVKDPNGLISFVDFTPL